MWKKSKLLVTLTLLLRGLLGSIGIIIYHELLVVQQMPCHIGWNPVSVLVIIFLGFPGFLLLCVLNFV